MTTNVKPGELRRLTRHKTDDEDGQLHITPAGSIVEVLPIDLFSQIRIRCPATGGQWVFSEAEWETEAEPVWLPENRFESADAFFIALRLDKQETLRQLMEAKIEENYDGTRGTLVEMLTGWAVHGVNLGDENTILGMAESHLLEGE